MVVVSRWEEVTLASLQRWREEHAASFDPATEAGRALADALQLRHWCRRVQERRKGGTSTLPSSSTHE